MIIEKNGRIWADTVSVQAAVTKFHGNHLGFGDFSILINGEPVYFERMDGTSVGDTIVEEYGFVGRPYRVEGNAQAIAVMIKEIQSET